MLGLILDKVLEKQTNHSIFIG